MIEQLAYSLGVMSGVMAMCMAIYMQLISRLRYTPMMVLAFWLFGCTLVAVNVQAFTPLTVNMVALQIVTYTVLLGGELYISAHLLHRRNEPAIIHETR